ncbi:hypothetical protein CSX02_00735 [Agathobacter ruminis]|uniref:Uncharacterized protein n=1 Tax=Agathobacter ruminis TaxID=1712665 RepID=A0A2G3E6J5_9FIRM|nr:hypothetical protein CSX02_00735 [Agathobacter ruminis]
MFVRLLLFLLYEHLFAFSSLFSKMQNKKSLYHICYDIEILLIRFACTGIAHVQLISYDSYNSYN